MDVTKQCLGNLPAGEDRELEAFRTATALLYELKEQAFAAGDPEPIVTRFYAEDAVTVGPDGKEIRGRDAFRAMYTRMVQDKTVKITPITSYVLGSAGWDWTNFTVMPNDPAKPPSTFIILFLWAFDGSRWVCGGDMFLSGELAGRTPVA